MDLDALLAQHRIVVVDYYATWCMPCKAYSPKFQRLEREMKRAYPEGGFAFVSVDVDQEQAAAREANVRSVPTTVAYTMGKNLFGRPKRKEILRYAGDKSWNELVLTFTDLLKT